MSGPGMRSNAILYAFAGLYKYQQATAIERAPYNATIVLKS